MALSTERRGRIMEFGTTEETERKYFNVSRGTILGLSERGEENKEKYFIIICDFPKFEAHSSQI
jgi:hypothetical protein